MKRHISENFRLITPINATVNTLMLGVIGFFMAQQYYRIDRIELKVDAHGEDIQHIKGYLKLSDMMCSIKKPKG